LNKLKLILPESNTEFAYSKYQRLNVIRCESLVRQKLPSDRAQQRDSIPEELENKACDILGLEKVTNKILVNYLRGKGLKTSGAKRDLLERVISSIRPTEDTRQDNPTVVVPIVLASEAGVYQEDDLEPDQDDEDSRM
jgi:hypothetical protein